MICDKCTWYRPEGHGCNVGYYTACKADFPKIQGTLRSQSRKSLIEGVMEGNVINCEEFIKIPKLKRFK